MKKRGEITVFLSLVSVCIMSLLLGLLESARTTGARLYSQMAADSAMNSVMSQYNRNLWEMYHLLFLETDSQDAVEQSFSKYLNFYLEQENLYPMKLDEVKVSGMTGMMADGGIWLEDGALSYARERMPEIIGNLAGMEENVVNAAKVGDFRELFELCRETGAKTRNLEKSQLKVEESLSDIVELHWKLQDAAESEAKGRFQRFAKEYTQEFKTFRKRVNDYETEVQKISEHIRELKVKMEVKSGAEQGAASGSDFYTKQEIIAYEAVEESAKKQLSDYWETKELIEKNEEILDMAEGGLGEAEENEADDWDTVINAVEQMQVPDSSIDGKTVRLIDREKVSLLDRLEELFQGDLLKLVLPEGTEVSENSANLKGIPSKNKTEMSDMLENQLEKALINEYCFLKFDSFVEKHSGSGEADGKVLLYEQEYLLCGEASDRENLLSTVEKLLTVRGAMNLLYLLESSERRTEADVLAGAVSGGNASVMLIVSFFILTMWAFGEAVLDVRQLMSGGNIPFWKTNQNWNLSLEALLALQFMESVPVENTEGRDYTDHMRVLFFLMDRVERNFRMMDVIQWNVRTVQKDFSVEDCYCKIEMDVDIREKHLFMMSGEYTRTMESFGSY